MSSVERKEYQETKIMRTVSPTRHLRSSSQNLTEFDHNLDYLLEDLQNSVSRPGSSLGTYRDSSRNISTLESNRTNSLNRFTNVKASNPATEYSSDDTYSYTSPDGSKKISGYKKESYSYKTSNGGTASDGLAFDRRQNPNQLDSLLDNLQQVKSSSFTENSYNNVGVTPDFHGGKNIGSSKTVHRELHYGDTPKSSGKTRTWERTTEREGSTIKDVQYSNEGTYGDLRQIRSTSPSPSSRTSTLSKQTKVTNVHAFPLEVVETTTPDINPEILAHLDPSLHPPGNTKVTTTIKTYTYEIPGSGPYPTNLTTTDTTTETSNTDQLIYSPNESQTTPSKSFVYKKIDKENINTINYQQPPQPKPQPLPLSPIKSDNNQNWESTKIYKETSTTDKTNTYPIIYQKPTSPGHTLVKETITTRNYQPNWVPDNLPPPPNNNNNNNQTYVYNETITTKDYSTDDGYRPPNRGTTTGGNRPKGPQNRQETYIIEETTDTIRNRGRQSPYDGYPKGTPPKTTYNIKEYEENTTNIHHQYPNGYPPNNDNNKTVVYRHETHTTNNYGPGNRGRPLSPRDVEPLEPSYGRHRPNEPLNIQYNYKSETTTTNKYKTGYPPADESQILLPKPFPTDNQIDGPPKKLDELMANIGREPPNSPYNASYNAHEHEMEIKRKAETLKQQQSEVDDLQKKEPIQKSKNVSGPPVYYPPGHEMFARKEEAAGWRAEGAYAREGGKYQYEAESKSKTKSSSGAAIVPVCLPLCCGLPCAII